MHASTPPQDHLQTGLAANGSLRWVATDITLTLEEVRRRLDLSPVAAVALGRTLTGAVLIHRIALKLPSMMSIEIKGDGPIGRVFGEVNQDGHLRGTVSNPHVESPATGDALRLAPAVGKGTLEVTRDGDRGRYSSQVELVSGELGDDLTHYLQQSEQIRSAVLLGVLPKPTGIAAAGGIIVEALPGTEDAVIRSLESNIRMLEGVSQTLERGGINGLAEAVLGDLDRELLETKPLEYRCRCDRESLRTQLQMLASDDLGELLREDLDCEAICAFCGERYVFERSELIPA